jgi:uncharacterized damage-inducible protein DinB
MADRKQAIIAELETAGEETAAFYAALSPDALERPVYTESIQWSVRQVLAHLVTIEKSMQWLFRNLLDGGPGAPEDFDIDRFNRRQPAKLNHLSLAELLDAFRRVRAETVSIVEAMTETDFDREGRHPFHGHGRLERFIRWAYEHQRLHFDDVRQALDASRHAAATADRSA